MKSYKNIKELNKEWSKLGFRINEKGELLGMANGKEYKCGKATFFAENGKPVEQKEIERERERENKNLKDKK